MSDRGMEILEQNVKHNTEDIRELKRRVEAHDSDVENLKIDNHSMKQNLNHVFNTLTRFESTLETLNKKFDDDKAERHRDQIAQLKEYKGAVWQVGIYLTCVLIGGFLLFKFGLR